jgi:hypothetical protein
MIPPLTYQVVKPTESQQDEGQWLMTNRISHLEREVQSIKELSDNGWMPIAKAASRLGKSPNAIRQRVKSKTKPMPEGKVWKQAGKGCEIFIHLKNFIEWL